MKFKALLTIALATAAIFVQTGCEKAEVPTVQNEVRTLRLANVHVQDYPTSKACDYFAQRVSEETNGKIEIKCYHNAELGDEKTTIELLKMGNIDFVRVPTQLLTEYDDSLNLLTIPFMFKSEAHLWNVLNSEIGQNYLNSEKLKENGIIGLNWYYAGSRNFYVKDKQINTLEDLSGIVIRIQESESVVDMVNSLGAKPIPLAFGEVYSAMVTGSIDGAENSWPSYISTKHYEVAKNIVCDEHLTVPEMIVASSSTMDSLTEEERNIIKKCAEESTQKHIEYWNAAEAEAKQTAIDAGCVITELSDAEKQKFRDAVQPVIEKYSAGYEELAQAIQSTPE